MTEPREDPGAAGAIGGADGGADAPRPVRRRPGWPWWVALVFVLFILVRTFAVEAFRIPTRSMEKTLLAGDFLLVNKAAYGAQVPWTHSRLPALGRPERGEVIVFVPPHDPARFYVKRVVGVAGDTLSMIHKRLFRNGEPVPEPYAQHTDPLPAGDYATADMLWQRSYLAGPVDAMRYRPTRDNWGPIAVPAGQFFVLGDNRDESEDSRFWGFVPGDAVRGRPLLVYYSFEPRSAESFPFLTDIRWDRIGGIIH